VPYQWAIEGDIEGCFDHIDHHALMARVRRRAGDEYDAIPRTSSAGATPSEDSAARDSMGYPEGTLATPAADSTYA